VSVVLETAVGRSARDSAVGDPEGRGEGVTEGAGVVSRAGVGAKAPEVTVTGSGVGVGQGVGEGGGVGGVQLVSQNSRAPMIRSRGSLRFTIKASVIQERGGVKLPLTSRDSPATGEVP
jgi:hypothetical protein